MKSINIKEMIRKDIFIDYHFIYLILLICISKMILLLQKELLTLNIMHILCTYYDVASIPSSCLLALFDLLFSHSELRYVYHVDVVIEFIPLISKFPHDVIGGIIALVDNSIHHSESVGLILIFSI